MDEIYRDIIDSFEDGIIVFDEKKKILFFNQAAEKMTGISKAKAIGSTCDESLSNNKRIIELVERTSGTGQGLTDHDTVFVRKSGYSVPLSVVTSPIIRSDGKPGGTLLSMRDIRRIKDLEEDVRRSDSLASVGVLAAGLAHEIRNPLGGIRGAAQLLEMETTDSAELMEYTSLIVRETDRVSGLIEELLDFANPKSLDLKEVNIHEILDSVIALESRSEEGREIEFIAEYDPSIPLLIGDKDKLAQVFINLVKNGCEAMKGKGAIKVITKFVGSYLLSEGGGHPSKTMAVEISDCGEGISEEDQKMIFTPFFTRKKKGSGLGLALSHRIIREHGGSVKIASNGDEGTTFTVFLPLR